MMDSSNAAYFAQLSRLNCTHQTTVSDEVLCIISRYQISMSHMSKTIPTYYHKNDSDFYFDLSIYHQDVRMVMAIVIVVLFVAFLYLLSICVQWCHCQCTVCALPQRNANCEPPFELRVVNRGLF